MAKTINSI